MKFRLLAMTLLAASCATPTPPPPLALAGPDDDHRWVSSEEFQKGPWSGLSASSWREIPGGVELILADGRAARLVFAGPTVARWWVPASVGETPLSPAARYPEPPRVAVKAGEGELLVATNEASMRITLADLSWTAAREGRDVVKGLGIESHGRRLRQTFQAAARWYSYTPHSWVDAGGETGPWALPGLWGAGPTPFLLALDNSYSTYTETQPASLGALNGGLDLLVGLGATPDAAVESMTAILGRPALPPLWAHGTALALPAQEPGDFIRKARLSVETAAGPVLSRTRFQNLVPTAASALPAAGAGVELAGLAGRRDWNTRFDGAPLARVNNLLAVNEATEVSNALQTLQPDQRLLLLAGSGAWGTVRSAQPELRVTVDQQPFDRALLLGAFGLSTPAVRLDLTPLAAPDTRAAAYQALLGWLMAPVLTLDWGPDPAALWAALPEPDRKRLKTILDRRSQFKPLFTQLAREQALTGKPAWRPLWWVSPSPDAAGFDEYLVGDDLLVAPVSGAARSVFLPGPGVWFEFWSGEEFGGGRKYDLEAKADRPLLFVRGGGFVPQRDAEPFDGVGIYNPLTMHVFPGGLGTGLYSLDDGRTGAWTKGYWESQLVFRFTPREMTLEHVPTNSGAVKPDPYLLYRVHNVYRPKQVKVDGKPVPLYGDSFGVTDSDRTAAWYESDHTLLIKTFRPEKAQLLSVSF